MLSPRKAKVLPKMSEVVLTIPTSKLMCVFMFMKEYLFSVKKSVVATLSSGPKYL